MNEGVAYLFGVVIGLVCGAKLMMGLLDSEKKPRDKENGKDGT
jgi:hypothetical protein